MKREEIEAKIDEIVSTYLMSDEVDDVMELVRQLRDCKD